MLALYNGESHDFIFRCYRGTTNVLEDFTGCQVFLFLVGSDKTKISATVDGKAIRFTLPSGINPEAYDVEVIWSKNASKTVTKYHLNHDVYNYALVTNAFAMTENSEEATNLASGQKVELTSHVATYGYDGLNAYETAVVYGITTALSEKEYVQIRASHVDTNQIASGAITTPKIADDAVTTEKIADSNVTTAKIADSNVTTAKIADSNVTTAKIADSNVTTGKIADGNVTTSKIADSNVTTVNIANSAVTTDKIADSNITTDKVADNAVVTAKIADGNVTTSKIADSNIVTDKIADDAVTTSKIADSNITEDKIADDAVTTSKIKNGNITTDKILDDNITTDKLATGAVTTAKILDSNVTTGKLADGAVTDSKIADSNVTTTKIADGAVSEGKLASGAVVGAKIADGAVTNGKIADGTIENGKLKDLTIEGGKIKDNTIENGKLKDLTVEGGKLKDGTLENGKFKDGSIEGVKIADGAVGGAKIASGSITGGNIAANAVTNDKIGSGEVKSGNIAQGAVTNDKLAQGAITDDKIADGALSTFETQQSARLTDLAQEVEELSQELKVDIDGYTKLTVIANHLYNINGDYVENDYYLCTEKLKTSVIPTPEEGRAYNYSYIALWMNGDFVKLVNNSQEADEYTFDEIAFDYMVSGGITAGDYKYYFDNNASKEKELLKDISCETYGFYHVKVRQGCLYNTTGNFVYNVNFLCSEKMKSSVLPISSTEFEYYGVALWKNGTFVALVTDISTIHSYDFDEIAFDYVTSSGIIEGEYNFIIPNSLEGRVRVLESSPCVKMHKNWFALGDSTTYGAGSGDESVTGNYSWADRLATKLTFDSFTKLAISGSVCMRHEGRYSLKYQIDKIPQHTNGLITVMIGTNDCNLGNTMGSVNDAMSKSYNNIDDENDFATAFRYNMETILRKFPMDDVVCMLPISILGEEHFKDYQDIERGICQELSIPVVETSKECGINKYCNYIVGVTDNIINPEGLMADAYHPNNAGYEKLANYMKGYFRRFS